MGGSSSTKRRHKRHAARAAAALPSHRHRQPRSPPRRPSALVPGQAYGEFTVAPKLEVGAADDKAEVEADQLADQVVAHLHDDALRSPGS